MPLTATVRTALVRYGTVPEVARFRCDEIDLVRGQAVVVETHRGPLTGHVLDVLQPARTSDPDAIESRVLRIASDEDLRLHDELRSTADAEFPRWLERIREWNVDVDLIDLECTIDGQKWILYVLSDRGPGSTQLALQAAAHGLGIIEVQPVASDGPVPIEKGGCGSGGFGCEH